ncbi:MAG: YopX family protein [Clostridiales bacterium]|nr:YopX family protein [Clostridiales bacterium]
MSREILFRAKSIYQNVWIEGDLFRQLGKTHILNDKGRYQVDPSTVCQYTGLTDKNGKKIFEGDIVYGRCNGLSGRGEIIWCNGGYAIDDKKCRRTYSFFNSDWVFRVDGNKWDTPELLEGGTGE